MMCILLFIVTLLPNNYEIVHENRNIDIKSERVEFQDYVPLKPVADLLAINYVLDNATQRLYLVTPDHRVEMLGNISTILYDGIYRNTPFAPLYMNGEVYFPVSELVQCAATFERLVFLKEIKEAPPIDRISLNTRGDSTVLRFEWQKPIDFDVQFMLKNAVVELDGQYKDKGKLTPVACVTSARLLPYDTYTRLEFDLENVNAYLERENEVIFYYKISKQVKLIVLDPGHGGIDPGAVGKKGLYEKDANLAIAKFLKDFIHDSLGVKVVMTREKDHYLSLKARTNIANSKGADLFVSIHCNASARTAKMTGFETYFLSEARTTEARAVEARENASLRFDGVEPDDAVSYILYDLAQSAYLHESNLFAECIQDQARAILPVPSRGVKQAGFYVLRGAFMPAVLVECAFVSNLEEEKLLKTKEFRQKCAHVIYCGIRDYIQDYERRVNN
jgi:N-acetylmuramoyl-L-alanine amidase